jgi:hypothetical protein
MTTGGWEVSTVVPCDGNELSGSRVPQAVSSVQAASRTSWGRTP